MNERIKELAAQADLLIKKTNGDEFRYGNFDPKFQKFAELIIEECRNVVTDVYRKTPLELCGPLLTADEEIAKHFYGV